MEKGEKQEFGEEAPVQPEDDVTTSPRMSIPVIKVNDTEHVLPDTSESENDVTTSVEDVIVIEAGDEHVVSPPAASPANDDDVRESSVDPPEKVNENTPETDSNVAEALASRSEVKDKQEAEVPEEASKPETKPTSAESSAKTPEVTKERDTAKRDDVSATSTPRTPKTESKTKKSGSRWKRDADEKEERDVKEENRDEAVAKLAERRRQAREKAQKEAEEAARRAEEERQVSYN